MPKKKNRTKANTQKGRIGEDKSNNVITKKDLLITFIIFFLVFGFVGYIRGRTIRNRPERLRKDVASRLRLGETNGRKVIVYQCKDRNNAFWDINENRLHNLNASDSLPTEVVLSPAIFKDDALTAAFLAGGGVASIFTVKEVFAYATASSSGSKFTNEGHIKLIVTALLATISGYEVGYQIALHENADCADSRFDNVLNDVENWKGDGKGWSGFETTYWLAYVVTMERSEPYGGCKASDSQTKDSEEAKLAKARVEFRTFINGEVSQVGRDLSATDFDALDKYQVAVNEFKERCGY